MENKNYANSDFFKFLSKTTSRRAKILENVTCGGPGTVESILSHKKNTRQDLANHVVDLMNSLLDAQKWLEKIHAAHFSVLEDTISLQNEREQKVMDDLNLMKSEIEKQTSEISNVRTYSEVVQQGKGNDVGDVVTTTVQTVLLKHDKKKNIIIYGAPGFMDSRSRSNWCSDLIDSMDCSDVVIASSEYIGPGSSETKRPLRLRLKSSYNARKMLNRAPRLRDNDDYHGIYLSADLTADERAKRKAVVAVLKERIRSHPETRWKISGDSVVDGGPFRQRESEARSEENDSEDVNSIKLIPIEGSDINTVKLQLIPVDFIN